MLYYLSLGRESSPAPSALSSEEPKYLSASWSCQPSPTQRLPLRLCLSFFFLPLTDRSPISKQTGELAAICRTPALFEEPCLKGLQKHPHFPLSSQPLRTSSQVHRCIHSPDTFFLQEALSSSWGLEHTDGLPPLAAPVFKLPWATLFLYKVNQSQT